LRNPDRLGLDPVHNEIFVPQGNSVLVFSREAKGNVAPIRVLKGPDTQLGASALAVDPVHDLLVVGGTVRGMGSRLLIFNRTDQGDATEGCQAAAPERAAHISGPTRFIQPKMRLSIERLWSSSEQRDVFDGLCQMEHRTTEMLWTWRPKAYWGWCAGRSNPKNKECHRCDKKLNAGLTFYFPECFNGGMVLSVTSC
jgi:hypothetical protein